MSFGWTTATWLAVGSAAATTVATVYSADSARKASNKAKDAATANAKASMAEQDRQNNKLNARNPDSAAMLAANMLAGRSGQSGTMLTGPTGVDPNELKLGKTSLLGG